MRSEDINASIDNVVIDELANKDEESVASSISTRSYDEKYRDPDWGTWTSPEGAKWEGYLVDNNFDPKGHDGNSGITGRFFTVDKYNETFDGDLLKGIRHGKGVYKYDDGTTYTGNWVHGKKHGQGRLEMASGEVYDGEWKDDKMHGYGVHLFPMGLHLRVNTSMVSGRDTEIMSVLMEKYTMAVFGQTNERAWTNGICRSWKI